MRSFTLSLALAGPLAVSALSGSGHSTRYWDCCKPSCAWNDKASVSAPVLTCDKNDNPISDVNAASGCGGGSSFTCSNNSPWAVNDQLAYGFAATKLAGGSEGSWCCACYALTFTTGPVKGKTMVVQSTNTGGDLGENHFDIQMPGGGVGIFDGCTPQWGALGGARYGGISSKSECNSYPELLKDGCNWRFDWFKNADNPDFTFEQVQCPKALTDITGCKRTDDSQFPAFKGDSSSGSTKPAVTSKAVPAPVAVQSTSKAAAQPSKAPVVVAPVQPSSKAPVVNKPATTKAAAQPTKAPVVVAPVQPTKAPVVNKPVTSKAGTKTGSCPVPKTSTVKAAATSAPTTGKTVAFYQQCGGSKDAFPNGSLPCASGSKCVFSNEWYSQCIPN